MKRNILKITFIAAVAVAAGYTAYSQSQKTEALSDLALENVEALASGELSEHKWERFYYPDGTGHNCSPTGDDTCI